MTFPSLGSGGGFGAVPAATAIALGERGRKSEGEGDGDQCGGGALLREKVLPVYGGERP